MEDCSKTVTYFKVKNRMTGVDKDGCCNLECSNCSLNSINNGMDITCDNLERNYPERAVRIVQEYADKHPPMTYRDDFLKKFPICPVNKDGCPAINTVPCKLYPMPYNNSNCPKNKKCADCWKAIMPE